MLFRERNCNGCILPRVVLNRDKVFQTLNSYNFKSIVVRPGCYVEERFKSGSSIVNTTYTDVEGHIRFKFTQESLNYSCHCNSEIIQTDLLNETESGTFSMLHGTGAVILIVGTLLVGIFTIVILKRRQEKLTNKQIKKYVKFVRLTEEQDHHLFLQSLNRVDDNGLQGGDRVVSLLEQQFNKVCEPKFRILRESFTVGDQIDEGQFGKVHKGRLASVEIAVKKIENGGDKVVESFLREVNNYNSLGEGHENIVKFFGACYHNGQKRYAFNIFELCDEKY